MYNNAMTPVTISYTAARQNLTKVMRECVEDSIPVIITSRKNKVVMVPYDDWASEQETRYLLENPVMAAHLAASLNAAAANDFVSYDNIDELRSFIESEN